jgi:uncharacterized BrkB/YihY/UPF0761 family membrane protein
MVKNKIREFGVFLCLVMFPIMLIVIGAATAGQRISDFNDGYIPLMPTDISSTGLVLSLIGCLVMVTLGFYILWSAIPKYKEYLNKCGSN